MGDNTISATVPFERPTPTAPVVPPQAAAPAETPAVTPAAPTVEPAVSTAETPTPQPTAETVDFSETIKPYQEELASSGVLSDGSLKALAEKLGAPLDVVQLTYEGMLSRQQRLNNEILQVAGGQETYTEMVKWASSTYAPEEAQAFNEALKSGDKVKAAAEVQKLRQKFTAVNGSPTTVQQRAQQSPTTAAPVAPTAAPAGNSGIKPFGSFEELRLAQRDKRYGSDPVFTAEVYQKAAISKFK